MGSKIKSMQMLDKFSERMHTAEWKIRSECENPDLQVLEGLDLSGFSIKCRSLKR